MSDDELFFKNTPTFVTERLILRRLALSDADENFAYVSDEAVTKYTVWDSSKTVDDSKAFISFVLGKYEKDETCEWCIIHKASGRLIGTIGFGHVDRLHLWANIGFDLAREFWGQGLMPEALKALIKFAFEVIGLNRLEVYPFDGDDKSVSALEKAGFRYEGTARSKIFAKGRYWDVKQYSVIKGDLDFE